MKNLRKIEKEWKDLRKNGKIYEKKLFFTL